jgi:flagellar motor switch protein FliM
VKHHTVKLIPAAQTEHYPLFPLTQEQRYFEQAIEKSRAMLPEVRRVINGELKQLISGINFEVDINVCQGSSLDLWLKEPGRLMLACALLTGEGDQAYLAMDHLSAHQLADLCLGGEISKSADNLIRSELSATERRVAGRLLHRTTLALQQRLLATKSALPAQQIEKPACPPSFVYLPFKVRIVMDSEVLSWFLWLPVGLFIDTSKIIEKHSNTSLLTDEQWLQFPVKGRIEMARKSISLSQLKACLKGQILPIEMSAEAIFKLDKKVLFKGRIAEENNSLAFQITQIKE